MGDVSANVTEQGHDMTKRSYWLDLFTGVTWNEFKEAGGKVSGFRESRWTTVQKIKPGDYLLNHVYEHRNLRA
jgi:hypothetical protein